jgi:DNA-directed RNA polymerase specialized sigma24 family protein
MSDVPIRSASGFAPTRWTLVMRSQGTTPEARLALSELCGAYWTPVFHFLRREGQGEDAARELAQEFFARVLAGNGFSAADPARGRFRSYLLGALRHFLGDIREKASRRKRGGDREHEALEPGDEVQDVAGGDGPPDAGFDREWALAVMARALAAVELDFTQTGKLGQFEALKPWLAGGVDSGSHERAVRELGLGESALKVAIHRLRKRFREAVRLEIAQTLPDGADPGEELRYLVEVLARG